CFGDRAGEPGSDDQGEQLNYGKDNGNREQEVFNALGEVTHRREQACVHQRWTGDNLQQCPGFLRVAACPVHHRKWCPEVNLAVEKTGCRWNIARGECGAKPLIAATIGDDDGLVFAVWTLAVGWLLCVRI